MVLVCMRVFDALPIVEGFTKPVESEEEKYKLNGGV